MGAELSTASWILLLHLLLLLMCAQGSGARDMYARHGLKNQLRNRDSDRSNNVFWLPISTDDDHPGMDGEHVHANSSSSSHKHYMIPQDTIFFTMADLKAGNKMPVYLPKRDASTYPHLLPRKIAESIPFSSEKLDQIFHLFPVSRDSPKAKGMEETLRMCETKPFKGETKFCPTSLESMLDFVGEVLGVESHFHALETKYLSTESKTIFQDYTICDVPEEIKVPKMVACHLMAYPHAIFYCHQQTDTMVFKVSLEGQNGDRIDAVAACHLDTSQWDPNHASFRVLGTKPGSSEVCHFFAASNLIWVPRADDV